MGTKSKIEWTDYTWNPTTGCSYVSQGCRNCYAVGMSKRLVAMGLSKYVGVVKQDGDHFTGYVRTHPGDLTYPLSLPAGRKVFVNSMSDLFHDKVTNTFVIDVLAIIALRPDLHFQVLTKRPDRMSRFMNSSRWSAKAWLGKAIQHTISQWLDEGEQGFLGKHWTDAQYMSIANAAMSDDREWAMPLKNLWLGVSCEDQKTADERIPLLRVCDMAGVHMLSLEPLLGPIDLNRLAIDPNSCGCLDWDNDIPNNHCTHCNDTGAVTSIDQVIVGGESGPKARPMEIDWVRSLRDQCVDAWVPFFFKQWGGKNKKKAGRILDGRTWDQMPESRRSDG